MRQRACGVTLLTCGLLLALGAWAGTAGAQTAGAPVVPIPGDPLGGSVTPFEGSAATPSPVGGMTQPPRNPFMAPNGRSNIHDDAYMSDTYRVSGPLSDGPEPSTLFSRECGSITFDSQGRIVTICVGLDRPVLALLDPHTLQTLAAMPLPVRNPLSAGGAFTDFSGGGYFFLDQHDRAVFSTNDHHVLVVSITGGPGFKVDADYDLSKVVRPDEGIVSVLPDWRGRLWFVTRQGEVGTIDRSNGAVRTLRLGGEGISNSFAVDQTGGVYLVSDKALYRFDANSKGGPRISWRVVYPNSGIHKPGQSDAGSGTTPTLMGKGWVAITDNADPMNVDVYRRALRLRGKKRHGRAKAKARLVCAAPVFAKGASSTDNSLIGTNRSLIAENNYGYTISAIEPGWHRQLTRAHQDRRRQEEEEEEAVPLSPGLDQPGGRALGGPQALPRQRARLHVHEAAPHGRAGRLVSDRPRLPHRPHRLPAPGRHRLRLQQQLRPRDARARRHGLRGRPRGSSGAAVTRLRHQIAATSGRPT